MPIVENIDANAPRKIKSLVSAAMFEKPSVVQVPHYLFMALLNMGTAMVSRTTGGGMGADLYASKCVGRGTHGNEPSNGLQNAPH